MEQILKQFNIEADERAVFLSLFSGGDQTASDIAKNTHIKRTTIYGILAKLQYKGLIEEIQKSNVKRYRVVDKETLKKKMDASIRK